jgi:hypothetical protein
MCGNLPSRVNQLDAPMLRVQITLGSPVVGLEPQLILGCRWYALLLTRFVHTQLALCDAWGGAPCCYWSAVGCDGRATVVEVGWRRCDGRATCTWSRLMAMRWLGDLYLKSADGAAMAGRLVLEVGWRRCDGRATCTSSRLTALRWPGDL